MVVTKNKNRFIGSGGYDHNNKAKTAISDESSSKSVCKKNVEHKSHPIFNEKSEVNSPALNT